LKVKTFRASATNPSYQGDLSEAEKKLSSVWNASSPDLGPSHGYQLAELDYLAAARLINNDRKAEFHSGATSAARP
jgi:hypothetical protein